MNNQLNQEGWDKIAERYQKKYVISLVDVHYGPFAPGEKEECLLGNVQGKKVLELGCGGGQNAIVLAKWGANVTGVDQSARQLDHAHKIASQEGVIIRFLRANVETIPELEDNYFDLILSSHALNYVEDIQAVFQECRRLLKPSGKLVICLSHPISNLVWEPLEVDDFSLLQRADYFKKTVEWDWDFPDGTTIPFESRNWTLEDIINGLLNADFRLERVREPRGYSNADMSTNKLNRIPYRWDIQEAQKFIDLNLRFPYSLIVVARKES